MARAAASRTNAGVSKSGSPAPRSTIARPSARRRLASCETAIVMDSRSDRTLADGVKGGADEAVIAVGGASGKKGGRIPSYHRDRRRGTEADACDESRAEHATLARPVVSIRMRGAATRAAIL